MLGKISIFIAFILFSVESGLSAESAAVNLDDRNAVQMGANDDPATQLLWTQEQLKILSPEKNPRQWVRLLWLHIAVLSDWTTFSQARSSMEKGIAIAEREGMHYEWAYLSRFLLEYTTGMDDSQAIVAGYQRLVDAVYDKGSGTAAASTLSAFALYHLNLGDASKALQLLVEANKMLKEDSDATEFDWLALKNALAATYSYQNQPEKTEALYRDIQRSCSRLRIRIFCVVNDYNLGNLLIKGDDQRRWAEAGRFFMRSKEGALMIHDPSRIANAHSGLITYHSKMGRYDEAILNAEQAIEIYKRIDDKIWLGDAYKKGARALIGARNFQQGLKYIDEASLLFPETFLNDRVELEELAFEAYEGLGHTTQALTHLKKHTDGYKKLTKEREQSEYSKYKANLGLTIEEGRNRTLTIENELQSQKLASAERTRALMLTLLALSLLVIVSMLVAVARSREVKISRMKMHRILSNIKEGILTINARLQIESEYSAYVNTLLQTEKDLAGQPALPILLEKTDLSAEQKSMIHEVLSSSLGAEELQWQLNEAHLPSELVFHGDDTQRVVAVHWQPLFSKDKMIQSVLIGLMDVTERRKLEMEIRLEREQRDLQGQLIRELAQSDARQVDALLEQAKALEKRLSSVDHGESRQVLLRDLHSIKGVARVLGLKQLSSDVHDLEDLLQNPQNPDVLREGKLRFLHTVDACLQIVQGVFGRKAGSHSRDHSLVSLVQSILPGVMEHFHSQGMELKGLDVVDRVMHWPHDLAKILEQIFMHALSNSADHGFILPRARGQTVAEPIFEIHAYRLDMAIELTIKDNGAGLDMKRLALLAEKHNFRPEDGHSIADVVFLDGATTVDQLSRTSGRGIGMAAIRSLCREYGGDVHMQPRPDGSGSLLTITLPFLT